MGSWILDAAEAEGRRKEKVLNQKEKEQNKQHLFALVANGVLKLEHLVGMFGLSKEELEKEYRDFQLA